MPTENQGFRGVSLKAELVEEVEAFLREFTCYRSKSEFISEAIRLRMEEVRKNGRKGD